MIWTAEIQIFKWRYDRPSGNCNLSNCKFTPPKKFATSTGFEPMASALALQCSNQLSYEDPCIGSKPICYNNNYLKLQASYKISPEGVILG